MRVAAFLSLAGIVAGGLIALVWRRDVRRPRRRANGGDFDASRLCRDLRRDMKADREARS